MLLLSKTRLKEQVLWITKLG